MKKILTLIIINLLSNISIAQTTAIPDINFEQELINLSYDTGVPDGVVLTASIDTILVLNLSFKNINSLAGIEDFIALKGLYLNHNQLTNLDITQNIALINLECSYNLLTSLNVTQNVNLTSLSCFSNQLTDLNVSQNIGLILLSCGINQLTCLNVKNGNNTNLSLFAKNNTSLNCIEVDDTTWATANWTVVSFNIDTSSSFSNNCNNFCSTTVGINEHHSLNFNIYPNPTANQLTIDTDLAISNVTIFNLTGKIITIQNQQYKLVNLTDLPSGIYFIKVTTEKNTITKKIVKQ